MTIESLKPPVEKTSSEKTEENSESNAIGTKEKTGKRRSTVVIVRSRATDPTVEKFAESLSKNGYEVDILLWDRGMVSWSAVDKSYRISRFNFKAPQDVIGALFYLPIWWTFEFCFLLKRKTDFVHAYDLDTLPPAALGKLVKRNRLFYTIGDFYANNLPEGRPYIARRLIRNLVASVEKFGTRFADELFLADDCRRDELGVGVRPSVQIMYNSPPDFSCRTPGNESGISSDVTVFYCGVISKSRGLEHMIRAVQGLDGIRLVIAGAGPDSETIRTLCGNQRGASFLGWLPSYEEVIVNSMKADILFRFSDPKVPKTYYESPNKLFEAMMCGKPIIVSDGSSMARIVTEENCGIVIPYSNVRAIREAVLTLKSNPELRKRLGENGRAAYERKYSWAIMEKRLVDAYDNVSVTLNKSGR